MFGRTLSVQLITIAYISCMSKFGVMNKSGKTIIPFKYISAVFYCEGLFKVVKRTKQGYEVAYKDKNNNTVIPFFDFKEAGLFNEGLAYVRKKSKFGFIDKTGKPVIPCKFDRAYNFENGLAKVEKQENCYKKMIGFINTKGDLVIPCEYDEADFFHSEIIIAKKNNKFGIINKIGTVLHSVQYDFVLSYTSDYLTLGKKIKNKFLYTVFDKSGKQISTIKAEECSNFVNGLAYIKQKGKHGVINKNTEIVISCKDQDIGFFQKGLALVKQNNLYGFINKKGENVIPCKYQEAWDFQDGMALVKQDGLFGFVNKLGELVIPYKYCKADIFHEGLAAVYHNGFYGFINKKGESVIPFKYEKVERFKKGLAQVMQKGLYGYIDRLGKLVVPCEYVFLNGEYYGYITATKDELDNDVLM